MMHHKPDPSSLVAKYAISTHRIGMLWAPLDRQPHTLSSIETSALATLGTVLCLLLCSHQLGLQLKSGASLESVCYCCL